LAFSKAKLHNAEYYSSNIIISVYILVQCKSKAYDDVENFSNKFTTEYLFLINHAENSIHRVNKSPINRK